jgi:lipopolysaccharide/colanic/teichoic acid biosynthesis glycosyltransferase
MDVADLNSDAALKAGKGSQPDLLKESATRPQRSATSAFGIRNGSATDRVHDIEDALNGGGAAAVVMPRPETLGLLPPAELYERQHGLLAQGVKRAFDLIGALLLVAVLAPAWLMIAFVIKWDSPGPVLFRQRRIGRDGETFWMLKFRTMVDGADAHKASLLHLNEAAEGLFKISTDPRITRVGRWLRATCLDELPQLFHVITGKMSLVGPRPLVPEEDARIHGRDRSRLQMRPGMTGVWQVGGASRIPIHKMTRLDLDYVENWSLWVDLKLLLQTAGCVAFRRGV